MKKRIVITGGHHNSALVVAQELQRLGHEVIWFGHRHSMYADRSDTAEYQEVTAAGIIFVDIHAGKLQTNYHFWYYFARIPIGFFQSLYYLLKYQPDIILSFGGYLALPVAIAGYFLCVPIYTHEQTVVAGLSNRIIGIVAKKIMLSYPSSIKQFPPNKTLLTGIPLRPEIKSDVSLFTNHLPTIYVTGGKQAAHRINEVLFRLLPKLLNSYNVIHQCGSNTQYYDYQLALGYKNQLSGYRGIYQPSDYFKLDQIGPVFHTADLVVSRAGAHIISELFALQKPAILIPLPNTHANEQTQNANLLKTAGLAEIIDQKCLTDTQLLELITYMINNLAYYHLKSDYKAPEQPVNKILEAIGA